jgi:hypothetical protein
LTDYYNTSSAINRLSQSQWYDFHEPENSSASLANHIIIQLGILKFQTLLLVVLLFICTCTYLHGVFPAFLDRNKNGCAQLQPQMGTTRKREYRSDNVDRPLGTFWRAARVGERLSPYVSLCCVAMAVSLVKVLSRCDKMLIFC